MASAKRDTPLQAGIENDQLVIRIGIDTLHYSAEHCPLLYDGTVENCDPPYCKVLDKRELARDVIMELFREREDGSSPISDLLDEAILAAMEDGSEAFEYE
jgi:hypothetical protein